MTRWVVKVKDPGKEQQEHNFKSSDPVLATCIAITFITKHLQHHDHLTDSMILLALLYTITPLAQFHYWACPFCECRLLIQQTQQED